MTAPFARPLAAVLIVALIGVPWKAAAATTERDGPASEIPTATPRAPDTPLAPGAIRASAVRWASLESRRGGQSAAARADDKCSASMAEKLAWLYALVGGSIMLAYGPGEKNGEVWTMDGRSETVAGAGSIVLSFFLLRDIRKKGW